jgi:hypothetical protein
MNGYVPSEFYLGQNYPNPFNEKTTIKYCVPYKTRVKITIHNSEGNMIEKLVDEVKEAGTYEVKFNGNILSSGEYFYIIKAEDFIQTKTMLLLK